jgi:hypothetical protein
MIRVDRGPEPRALAEARWWRLARAILAHRAGQRVTFEPGRRGVAGYHLTTGYDVATEELDERCGHVCSYCEWPQTGRIVEHFRPKESARNSDDSVDDRCYWWLAWSWENHLFSCSACNNKKGNYFPVNGARVTDLSESFESEAALLIDPGRDLPMSSIVYVHLVDDEWMPIGLDERGKVTVELFELYMNGSLSDHYRNHVNDLYRNEIPRIKSVHPTGLTAVWEDDVLRRWIWNPQAVFRALTWFVLDHEFPESWRSARGVELPRPDDLVEEYEGAQPIRADLEELLGEETLLAVRAVGPHQARGSKFVGPNALVEDGSYFEEALARVLKKLGAQGVEALMGVFNEPFVCSKEALVKALQGLEGKGLIGVDAGCWSWCGA